VSDPYLEIRGVSKSFGLKFVLRKIDVQVYAGERVVLLGANGTGKTTLLRILAGLTRATAGTITLAGLDLTLQTREVRRKIGFVAHQPYLYEELTALENLLFFARMYDVEQPQARALALLERVGLSKKARERVSAFSRGQTQRLALARALLHMPSLLLLDEPETGLDQNGRALLTALLAEHRTQGGTVLFTTHELYQQETAGQETAALLQIYQEATG
jgi:heme ABC exporter ATP-binding subunit CcmA